MRKQPPQIVWNTDWSHPFGALFFHAFGHRIYGEIDGLRCVAEWNGEPTGRCCLADIEEG